jgi:hypothetical protein
MTDDLDRIVRESHEAHHEERPARRRRLSPIRRVLVTLIGIAVWTVAALLSGESVPHGIAAGVLFMALWWLFTDPHFGFGPIRRR